MEAFICLRVSTLRQAREGVSISRDDEPGFQEQVCRDFCKFKRWEIPGPPDIDAGVTGRREGLKRRVGLAAAVEKACEAKGVLVVYSIARLGRSIGYVATIGDQLKDAGANLASATEDINTSTAIGKAFFGLAAVFAQLESDQISERGTATHAHLREKHGRNVLGEAPYGYSRAKGSRTIVPNPAEQAVLALAKSLRRPTKRFGKPTSCAKVAEQLNALGHRTRTGGLWHRACLRRILLATEQVPA